MSKFNYHLTWLSSLVVRFCSFFFLRWIPGHHFPPVIYGSFLIYLSSFYATSDWPDPFERPLDSAPATQTNGSVPVASDKGDLPNGEPTSAKESDQASTTELTQTDSLLVPSQTATAGALQGFLTGLPSNQLIWDVLTLGFHTLLVLMVADLVYRGPMLYHSEDLAFARIGFVDDSSAKFLVREPHIEQLPLYLSFRKHNGEKKGRALESSWKSLQKIYYLSNDTDYTYPMNISGLMPSTKYDYSLSNGIAGSFTTAPRVGQVPSETGRFTFLTTSCLKPRFPYNPLSHPLSIPGLEHLASTLSTLHASFMLFLGDFIYIDVPHRFGSTISEYRSEYRRVYASPSWTASTLNSLPWIHVLDDHEIANDWDQGPSIDPYPAAMDGFNIYHHAVNPPTVHPNTSYYSFTQGPVSFFLLDTRRYRSSSTVLPPTDPAKTMLGPAQRAAVLAWLAAPLPSGVHWKILVSSVPFTRNWRVNALDTWGGYLVERQLLLEAMWDATSSTHPSSGGGGPGIVILSGDRHEFAATSFPAPDPDPVPLSADHGQPRTRRWAPGARVTEFSASPLSMFYLPVRTYREVVGEQSGVGTGGEDRCITYIPDGNSKFGAVEVENEVGSGQSVLRYRLFVDGKERWSHVVTTLDGKDGGREAVWG